MSTNHTAETLAVPVLAVTPRPCNQHFGAPFHLNSPIIRTPDYPLPLPLPLSVLRKVNGHVTRVALS